MGFAMSWYDLLQHNDDNLLFLILNYNNYMI